jgi:hypothetical protein
MRQRDGFTQVLVDRTVFRRMGNAGLIVRTEDLPYCSPNDYSTSWMYITTDQYYRGLEKLREWYSVKLVRLTLEVQTPEEYNCHEQDDIGSVKKWLDHIDNELREI